MRKASGTAAGAAMALALLGIGSAAAATGQTGGADMARWRETAAQVSIVRDDYGIAHVHGHTDAQAVFGMIYAQAEDDFARVEANYLTQIGWMARAKGEAFIWQDLRQRLFLDVDELKAKYQESPPWLKTLMNAWADGLNFYLATHPSVHPLAISHFEPWMALSFSEGSIGGDIERVDLNDLRAFYDSPGGAAADQVASSAKRVASLDLKVRLPSGSNGVAIAPKNTVDGHALLLINPHTSFFFRSELQMTSDEGLNAYGAATWGQFFIYQGFNAHTGWMHTSSGVDNVDRFAETIVHGPGGRLTYAYGKAQRPVTQRRVTIDYRHPDGAMGQRVFTVYKTHHGPIIAQRGGKWIAMALMNTPVAALEQSFLRTKTTDLASYMKVAQLKANSSNNTLFADDKGEIAYLHPQFVPIRSDRFDYTRIVDGSDPGADWHGLTPLDKLPSSVNPAGGFVFNTNDWPYSAAGRWSPHRQDFPRYMDRAGENPRGVHALELLQDNNGFTLEGLMHAAYDSHLPAFDQLLPPLFSAYDALPAEDPLRARLAEPIAALRAWDHRWGADSVATTLASFWGDAMGDRARVDVDEDSLSLVDRMLRTSPHAKLEALDLAVSRLDREFGAWRTPWGQVNRFQRLKDQIVMPAFGPPSFDDAAPSIPVPFTTSRWGSLAAFEAKPWAGTKKWYGVSGNSFVAVVEFGPRVRARAVTAGGESGDPASPHFNDEAGRYAAGDLREVYFWPDQLAGHTQKTYRPGE